MKPVRPPVSLMFATLVVCGVVGVFPFWVPEAEVSPWTWYITGILAALVTSKLLKAWWADYQDWLDQ